MIVLRGMPHPTDYPITTPIAYNPFMTTINDVSDLVRILREQPEWAATMRGLLLTDDLLNLPAQLAQFIQVTEESNRLVQERLTRLEELAQAQNKQLELLQEAVTMLANRVNTLDGRVGNIDGILYERGIRNRLLFRARHVLGFTDPYIAHVQDDQSAPEINRAVSLALAGGVVSLAQCEDLQAVDIIISDSDNRHLLIEASITADFSDVDRAGRRAEILKLITGGEVTPAIATAVLTRHQESQVASMGVTPFIIPYT